MALVDEFMESLGGPAAKSLASGLGINKSAASQIEPAVVPMILGGLKRQMETQGGAARLDHILNKYGSDSVLDDVAGMLFPSSGPPSRGGGILGKRLGSLFGRR